VPRTVGVEEATWLLCRPVPKELVVLSLSAQDGGLVQPVKVNTVQGTLTPFSMSYHPRVP